jgi:hypothetical protein
MELFEFPPERVGATFVFDFQALLSAFLTLFIWF